MRRYEYGDPAKVLERRGEDCTNCKHLGIWKLGAERLTTCDNPSAPDRRRREWRHTKADGGQNLTITPYIEVQLIAWGRWASKAAARAIGYPSTSPMFKDAKSSCVHESSPPFGIDEYVQDTDLAVQRLEPAMRALCVEVYQIGGTQREIAVRLHTSQSGVNRLIGTLHQQVMGHLNDIAAGV